MKIGEIRMEGSGGAIRAAADVTWEDSDRPTREIFFEIESPGELRTPSPDAFLAALAVPALHGGERRIAVHGTVCPRMRDGVVGVCRLLRSWHAELGAAPAIEPSGGFRAPWPAPAGQTGLFLSGGVDSLYTLAENRRDYPAAHPRAMRHAIFVRGLMMPFEGTRDMVEDIDRRALPRVARLAAAAGLMLSTVRTNLGLALDEHAAYAHLWAGAFLAAIAHLFTERLSRVTIASSHDLVHGLIPWGTDPLLETRLSTGATEIDHSGIRATRLAKIREVGRWNAALEALVVCGESPLPGPHPNCGRCEKCVRTRAGLLAAGRLAEAVTFPDAPLDAAAIATVQPANPHVFPYFWDDMVEPLRAAGRPDLADAVSARCRREMDARAWHADSGWKGRLRRIDRRWFGGRMLRWRRSLGSETA